MKSEKEMKCIALACCFYINWHRKTYNESDKYRLCTYYHKGTEYCSKWDYVDPFKLLIVQIGERKNEKRDTMVC